jgi:hypothetical protein
VVTVPDWWHQLSSSALLGTSRKPPPTLLPALGVAARPEGGPEVSLLDAAAVGAAVLRSGRPLLSAPPVGPAPVDERPPAPPAAVQLLDLLLTQPPVPAALVPLALRAWLRAAGARGARIPHRHLPRLLSIATRREVLRDVARRAGGARMTWLATQNPEWQWLLADEPSEPAAVRPSLPEPAEWRKLPVKERRALLADLDRPEGPAEVAFLESALDDRAETVRRDAQRLLDAAPDSPRAARMAQRLRPLLRTTGVVRTSLEIDLPDEPDAAGVRDGLGRAARGSQRAHWLEQLAAGAPLDAWTDATGRPPEQTVAMIREPAALAGILRAVRARRDPTWARALLPDHPDLFPLLQADDRTAAALRIVRDDARPDAGTAVVFARLRRRKQPPPFASHLLPSLAAGLDPAVLPAVRQWEHSDHHWDDVPTALTRYLALTPAITEAFR